MKHYTLYEILTALKAGEKLMIFPEGTRVHGDAVVKPKSGVFRAPICTGTRTESPGRMFTLSWPWTRLLSVSL